MSYKVSPQGRQTFEIKEILLGLYLESFKDERSIGSSNLTGWWLA